MYTYAVMIIIDMNKTYFALSETGPLAWIGQVVVYLLQFDNLLKFLTFHEQGVVFSTLAVEKILDCFNLEF